MRIPSARAWSLLIVLGVLTALPFLHAQTVTDFEGIDASQLASPEFDVDPNGAVGTKQYLEWTNVAFQAFDKVTFQPVWSSPQPAAPLWTQHNQNGCASITGDGYVLFDRLASRWVIAAHNSPGISGTYFYCVAISNTDDLSSPTLTWRTFAFKLNSVLGTNSAGNPLFPDWPKLGTWIDAYYLAFDLLDPNNHYQPVGAVVCALDRTNMLTPKGTPRLMQCFTNQVPPPSTSRYLSHSLIPADVEGTTPPPAGRHEYLVSIQNPTLFNSATTSRAINLWDFHVDWITPSNSTFTNNTLTVTTYTPGCYSVSNPGNTFCVPEPILNSNGTHHRIDSVGDRLMPRLSYRNFGTRESFVFSHTIRMGLNANQQTGIRWYELDGNGLPGLHQSGTIKVDSSTFRFMPSMAQDKVGNAAVGYNLSSTTIHPGLAASWWNLPNPTSPVEVSLYQGNGDEGNANNYGDYNSLTVDPVDGCTFWFVAEYFASNQTGNLIKWNTRIAFFKLPGCN